MLPLPKPSSHNPVAFFVKKVMRKLTAWEIDPIVHQLNAVHRAAAHEVAHDRDETETRPAAAATSEVDDTVER